MNPAGRAGQAKWPPYYIEPLSDILCTHALRFVKGPKIFHSSIQQTRRSALGQPSQV